MAISNPLARNGGLTYLLIAARDPAVSATFYADVVGWKIHQRSPDDFRFSDPGGMLIGRFEKKAVEPAAGFVPYVYVDDLAATLARVPGSGGAEVEAARTEGDTKIARVKDPSGNLLGLWQFA